MFLLLSYPPYYYGSREQEEARKNDLDFGFDLDDFSLRRTLSLNQLELTMLDFRDRYTRPCSLQVTAYL